MSDSIPDQLIGLHLHWRHHLRRGHHLRRRVVDLPELVVGKRPRVPSITVHLSLFLFVRTSRTIDTVTIPDTYKCFHDIITSGAWLADDISEVVILIIFMTYISLFVYAMKISPFCIGIFNSIIHVYKGLARTKSGVHCCFCPYDG
ncbi:uncharacterized protein LOC111382677 isoform X3 [Olea europaea var. sylvestris]|uniref:uncharacterized protein LOC111382677 isoform X3 n=1 Tax=Olea europaea var. sylvestris TaxID=158386 RepID=UPI000C1CE4B7|nr:uncharacterized protein LOC111382677 isoform X3 [Olea europaea var. sylvestris]